MSPSPRLNPAGPVNRIPLSPCAAATVSLPRGYKKHPRARGLQPRAAPHSHTHSRSPHCPVPVEIQRGGKRKIQRGRRNSEGDWEKERRGEEPGRGGDEGEERAAPLGATATPGWSPMTPGARAGRGCDPKTPPSIPSTPGRHFQGNRTLDVVFTNPAPLHQPPHPRTPPR